MQQEGVAEEPRHWLREFFSDSVWADAEVTSRSPGPRISKDSFWTRGRTGRKVHDRMVSFADSTDARVSDFMGPGFDSGHLLPGDFPDLLLDDVAQFDCDDVPWPVQTPAASEPLLALKFIKDEKVVRDSPAETLDRRIAQGGFASPAPDGSPNFEQNPPEPLVRTDSMGSLMGNFDPGATQQAYKSSWHVTKPAEPQYWCQSTEDPYSHSYHFIQNQSLCPRNPSAFSTYPGMPPRRVCLICSDEASGCHYGVLTCGSCKVFFKRAVEGHHSYLCAGRSDCIVDKIRRKNCPACRLRKCYQAGMMLGGRKLKRFGALKALGLPPTFMFQSHLAMSNNGQALSGVSCIPGIREVQFSQLINVLENIEPEEVYSGYDSSQGEVPHVLLSSLNNLCDKQLRWVFEWSKSLPGFQNLHINDQMTLIQYSWNHLLVFYMGWCSFQNVTSEFLYFAPDLILSQEQMRRSPIYDLCLAIQFIPQEFTNLKVTREEFLCMKAIILLTTVPLEGLKSQGAFEEMRQSYIRELTKVIHKKEKSVVATSQRFFHLTKLMDATHEIVKKVNLFCLSTFVKAGAMRVEFPEMMSEVIASQLPKVLAGMVRPLMFHHK